MLFREGERVAIDLHNETDTPEQVHWHGQFVSTEVDGAAEEGTPFVPPHGSRRISFVPRPSGFRFYHTHARAGADLSAGMYGGLVGPVYIEPKQHPGNYDREVFLTMKEFQPTLSRDGDMAMDFLSSTQGKCSRHPRYNPEKVAVAGIRGGCAACRDIYHVYHSRLELDRAVREFQRHAAP